jgi:hypothetical protein
MLENTNSIDKKFPSALQFSLQIEEISSKNNLTILESIVSYCEDNMIDPSDITGLINQTLKDKLETDFRSIGMLPKIASLEDYFGT